MSELTGYKSPLLLTDPGAMAPKPENLESWVTYSDYIRRDKTWGGIIEILALNYFFKTQNFAFRIQILNTKTKKFLCGYHDGPIILLSYNGENHYNLLSLHPRYLLSEENFKNLSQIHSEKKSNPEDNSHEKPYIIESDDSGLKQISDEEFLDDILKNTDEVIFWLSANKKKMIF